MHAASSVKCQKRKRKKKRGVIPKKNVELIAVSTVQQSLFCTLPGAHALLSPFKPAQAVSPYPFHTLISSFLTHLSQLDRAPLLGLNHNPLQCQLPLSSSARLCPDPLHCSLSLCSLAGLNDDPGEPPLGGSRRVCLLLRRQGALSLQGKEEQQ